ncbi:peptidylprolyl isomerase [Pedobacter nutrimenti]|uniref:peptidylprolyl isomerase n=1 Tax=Pedobacter nutrimenti TaxID=1241337 RepID=UPI0029313C88|nr:peptidylprolyl isomerase [Pedobacter nutrimenti]
MLLFRLPAVAQNKTIDKIIAVVGNEIVLLSDLNMRQVQYISAGTAQNQVSPCYILQQILVQKLLKQQAMIDSIMVDDNQVDQEIDRRIRASIQRAGGEERLEQFLNKSILQYKDEIRPEIKDLLIADKMQGKITENVSITPREVEQYFKSYKKDSLPDIGTEYEIGEIVLHPELSKLEKQKYFDKLDAIRLRVKSGEGFGFLAKTYSEDPGSAAEGGDLGFFDRGTMVKEFTAMAFKLKAGEVSPVFETENGFHILQVLERRGEQVHARHILIIPKTTALSLERLKNHADTIYADLTAKKLSFSDAAARYSDNKQSKYNGGMLLYADEVTTRTISIPAEKLDPKIFLVVDTMKAPEISKPVFFSGADGKDGYKILFLKSKVAPHKGNLNQDYVKFKERAQELKVNKALSEWFEKRRGSTFIKIDADYLGCKELEIWRKKVKD